jgi:hypothetical protein
MRNIMKATLHGAPGPDGKITGFIEEFHFEATVQYMPAALDEAAWQVIRLYLWTENADTSPTGAPCCVKYEKGEWVSDPAHPREEAATQALIQRLWKLPPPIRI